MQVILRLVKNANIYMNDKSAQPNLQAVEAVARWVTKIVGILGLDASAKPPYNGLGWASASAAAGANLEPKVAVKPYAEAYAKVKADVEGLKLANTSIQNLLQQQTPDAEFAELEKSGERDVEKLAMPYLRATSGLRDELRAVVSALESSSKQAVLTLSDRIRDYDLTDLGVQLDDQTDKPSLIKFVPAAKLIAARDEKAALLAEKARQKEEGMSCSYVLKVLIADICNQQRARRGRKRMRRSGPRPSCLTRICSRPTPSTRSGTPMGFRLSSPMAARCPRARSRS